MTKAPERPNRKSAFDLRSLAGDRWPPPDWHFEKIAHESSGPESKDGMMGVIRRMAAQEAPDFADLDWDVELEAFGSLDLPDYYRQPFHSVPGGYLSEAAATNDRRALEAIYQDAHPGRSLGIREDIATLVPENARSVVEFGAGTGDGAAAIARRFPTARVMALEASPFMIIAGRTQNADLPNLEFVQGLAEETNIAEDSVDLVLLSFLLHECPDTIKRDILDRARRILRPGGMIVLNDTPPDSLDGYRGFYEPYREQWRDFDPETSLAEAGFEDTSNHEIAPTVFTRTATKTANPSRSTSPIRSHSS